MKYDTEMKQSDMDIREDILPYYQAFAKNLTELTKSHMISEDHFCQEFWIERWQYEMFLKGTLLPETVTLIEICAYFNISIDKMLGFSTV